MFGRFSDKEVMDCLQGNEIMYMASEEYLDELRSYVDRKYPGLRQAYRMNMYPPREKEKEKELEKKKEPEKEQHRIYGYTDDELKKILGTDEHPAEALEKYGLLPIYSALQSMQWRMEEMSRALSMIAEAMTKEEDE